MERSERKEREKVYGEKYDLFFFKENIEKKKRCTHTYQNTDTMQRRRARFRSDNADFVGRRTRVGYCTQYMAKV